jgi:isoaspartyl peptidase/L-asparaginase-like protein (Ntn-hydrolase superfamily)
MLVGDGALQFARSQGFEEENLLTEKSRAAHQKWKKKGGKDGKDTIGMIAIDDAGNIAAACTTSGLAWKIPGRVGDSPLVGAGLYADTTAGGASATGVGEEIIKICGSFLIVESIRRGASPQEACDEAIRRTLEEHPENEEVQVAYIALDRKGNVGAASVRPGFQYALRTAEGSGLHDVKAAVGGEK